MSPNERNQFIDEVVKPFFDKLLPDLMLLLEEPLMQLEKKRERMAKAKIKADERAKEKAYAESKARVKAEQEARSRAKVDKEKEEVEADEEKAAETDPAGDTKKEAGK